MCSIHITYNFHCVNNSPWQVEIINKMARIHDHDELIQIRYITLGKRQFLPILKCIIQPILKKYHSNRSAAVRMHLTSIYKCIFDIAHDIAVTRTNP